SDGAAVDGGEGGVEGIDGGETVAIAQPLDRNNPPSTEEDWFNSPRVLSGDFVPMDRGIYSGGPQDPSLGSHTPDAATGAVGAAAGVAAGTGGRAETGYDQTESGVGAGAGVPHSVEQMLQEQEQAQQQQIQQYQQ